MKHTNTHQIRGAEVTVDWTIGRAPLALRGIRFADGGEGGNGGEGGDGGQQQQPAPKPAPPAAPQVVHAVERPASDWYHPDYVRGLRDEAQGHREHGAAVSSERDAALARAEAAEARIAEFEAAEAERGRVSAISKAAADLADVDALLDSNAFTQALEGVDVTDEAAARAAVEAFVEKNPRFGVQGQEQQRQAPRQHGAPLGGGAPKGGPKSLGGAIGAHYAAR